MLAVNLLNSYKLFSLIIIDKVMYCSQYQQLNYSNELLVVAQIRLENERKENYKLGLNPVGITMIEIQKVQK